MAGVAQPPSAVHSLHRVGALGDEDAAAISNTVWHRHSCLCIARIVDELQVKKAPKVVRNLLCRSRGNDVLYSRGTALSAVQNKMLTELSPGGADF